MLIGILSTLFIAQLYTVADSQRRTISHGSDALTNGAIALHVLERELREAGVGISATDLFGCNLTLRSGITLNTIAPVTINHAGIPAGDANTDTLVFVKSNSYGAPEGDRIEAQMSTTSYTVRTPSMFLVGERVIAAAKIKPSPCDQSLDTVASVNPASDPNVNVTIGAAGVAAGKLFNVGADPQIHAYAVRNGSLAVCDYMLRNCGDDNLITDPTVWVPVASNVVSLRAQYGQDTSDPGNRIVDSYSQTLLTGFATECAIARNLSVRLVVIARSTQFEKTVGSGASAVYVTSAAPTWEGGVANNPTGSVANPITLSKNPDGSDNPDWKNYRYRSFETLVPLRNVLWMEATGC